MLKPKPKVYGDTEETIIRSWPGEIVRRSVVTLWRAVCPCHRNGEFALVVTPSWREALDVALEHERTLH